MAISTDVRMRGFSRRVPVATAWAWVATNAQPLPREQVSILAAHGRVLAEEITSQIDVPQFARAMMDGFAVRAEDTDGASSYNRLPLRVTGESLPGHPGSGSLSKGQAIRIMTGAPMPSGADAVLPAEKVEIDGSDILALDAVSPAKHVGSIGEDVKQGEVVFRPGRQLRPQDIGVLSSLGISQIAVVRAPIVRVIVTGNELLPAGTLASDCHIADANGPMLAALIQRDGGIVRNPGIIADDVAALRAALLDDADLLLVSGGSSVGQEDHAPVLLAELGELAIHGIAMRPSSPAGMGRIGDRLVFLLPGNPVSCLCAYDFFAGRAIRELAGRRSVSWPYRTERRRLQRKLVSTIGRVDYARVTVGPDHATPLAISGASMLSSTTRADGFVVVPADSEGYPADAEVEVFMYDG